MGKPSEQSVNIIQGEGGGCFAAGTKISTPNGSVDIENVKVGDEVLSFDDTGEISTNKVTKVFVHEHNEIYSFKFWGGELLLNKIHWILNGRNAFFQAGHFNPEECIVDESGEFRPFKSLDFLEIGTVYNFWVENNHTYIANEVRVHNGGGGGAKGVASKRDSYEAPEGIVYEDLEGVRYVSSSTIQILDLIGEGPIEGLVRGEHKYEGKMGRVGFDKAFFYRNNSKISGGMAGITAEIAEDCEYGIFNVAQDDNLVNITCRLDGASEFYIYVKSSQGPTQGASSMGADGLGSSMWMVSETKQKTFPFVESSIVYGLNADGSPKPSWVVGPKLSDSNGGADHIGGNWRTFETAEGGKNHTLTYTAGGNEPTLGGNWNRSYKFGKGEKTDVDLPLFHAGGLGQACLIESLQLTAKTSFSEAPGIADAGDVDWVPMVSSTDYSDSCVRVKTQPSEANDYCMVIHVSSKEGLVEGKVSYDGTHGTSQENVDWVKVEFSIRGPRKRIICKGKETITINQPEFEIVTTDGFEYLRSVKWNQTPVLDSTGLLNFQQVRLIYANGEPNGSSVNEMGEMTDDLQRTRAVGERLVGPTSELTETDSLSGNTLGTLEDFTKVYRINNKHCTSVTVNVRLSSLSQLAKKEGSVPGHPSHNPAGNIDLSFSPEQVQAGHPQGNQTYFTQPEESESAESSTSTAMSVQAGDLVRTAVEYLIQWKPVFDTPGSVIEWPGVFDQSRFYGNTANSTISPAAEVGQIHEIVYGKISYGYNKSTKINLLSQSDLVNRKGFIGWEIRLIRLTPEPITAALQNSTFVDSLTEHYRSNLIYPNAAMISQEFDAEYFSNVPERSFDVELLKVKVPSNYNPRLKTYGQERGGVRYLRRAEDTPEYSASFLSKNYDEWLKYKGFAWDANLGGGVFTYEGGDSTVNGTTEIWDGTFKEVATYQPDGVGPDTNTKSTLADHNELGPQKAGVDLKQYTNNPAWCFYDLMTNRRYGLGKHLDESLLDKWSIYEIGQYCDQLVSDGRGGLEPRFTCNLQINQREDAFKVINDMASIFRGMTYYQGGLIHTIQDKPQQPIFQFNNTNVMNGEFNYQSTSKKVRRNVAVIRYNDPFDGFRPAVEYVENISDIKKFGIRELEITAFGCTSRAQAKRLGNWSLISESLETETVGFTAGLEASYLRPGDIVQVFDYHRRHRSHGGRTQRVEFLGDYPNYTGANVILDRPITGLEQDGLYRFSLLTPSYFVDPNTVTDAQLSQEADGGLVAKNSMVGKHFRHTALQDLYFQGKQANQAATDIIGNVTGVTKIKFSYTSSRGGAAVVNTGINGMVTWPSASHYTQMSDGSKHYAEDTTNHYYGENYPRSIGRTGEHPITGFNVFEGLSGTATNPKVVEMPLVWSIERSGDKKFAEKNYEYYKILKIEEKENQYAVTALEHNTGKFALAESGLSFDRETYGVTPSKPANLTLESHDASIQVWGGPPDSIRYEVHHNEDVATVGYNVYVKPKNDFENVDVDQDGAPHPRFLYARHTQDHYMDTIGYYIPSADGQNTYYFRAYSENAAGEQSTEFVYTEAEATAGRYINNVIINNLSMVGETTDVPEVEDKSYGALPAKYFASNELQLQNMAIATGTQLTSNPRFTWQAGYKNMPPAAKTVGGAHRYRLTVRTPSADSPHSALYNADTDNDAWVTNTDSDGNVTSVTRRAPNNETIYEPSDNVLYEVMLPSNGAGAFPSFRYFKNLNISVSKQGFVPNDNDGSPILNVFGAVVENDTQWPSAGPFRHYDVVVEAIDDDGNSSATLGINDQVYGDGNKASIYTKQKARKDVEYTNPYGFDVFFVSNPRMPSLNISRDIKRGDQGISINVSTRELNFALNRGVIEGDTAGIFCWASTQPFTAGSIAQSNCNKDSFVTDYYSHTTDYSQPTWADTIYDATAKEFSTTAAGSTFKIHRSHFDMSQGTFGDMTVNFDLGALMDDEASFDTLYVAFAFYDNMDRSNLIQYLEDQGGATDKNQVQAENRVTKELNLSVQSNSDSSICAAITRVQGSAEHMEAYISVTTQDGQGLFHASDDSLKNIKWTNLNVSSYKVVAKFTEDFRRAGTAARIRENEITEYEHTANFDVDKVKFNNTNEYRVIASKNVTNVTKNLTSVVFTTPHKSHVDMKLPITVEVYRDMKRSSD